ncbi:zonular occludens toxin domain-containing protein [Halomonas beimenensis]|uniref:Zona occludens toxin, predicted ATPase n=1 Tax=Halomonas beimenensis TaxID=475662 RepID=A0A291P9X7_9GAMM|nr:zonular occludens toxin domain-containing protein [Halomonas beimenensis]ATJ83700.1 zona occludens toxin, predicted ATPase [Halomonas beimenensis]
MAIHLISGVPGAGKTLRAVYTMINWLRTEEGTDRPFFGNVRDLRNQAPIPDEWMDVPDGSLILIDEVQQRWRRYRNTGEPPPEIAALETHRHRGVDFILTCQNPSQLTSDVRALVDTHEHLMRKGKLNGAIVWRWEGVCHTNPAAHSKDADCESSIWKYPKWVFEQYTSASMHTGKKRLPRILVMAPLVLVGAIGAVILAITQVTGYVGPEATAQAPRQAAATANRTRESEPDTVTAYAGTLRGDDDTSCRLYDQQGMPIVTSLPQCLNALERGLPFEVEVLDL